MSFVGPITDQLINSFKEEMKKEETQKQIFSTINPVVTKVIKKNMKYIYGIVLVFILLLILVIYNTSLLIKLSNKVN